MVNDAPLFEGPDFGPEDEEIDEEELAPELEEENEDDEGNRVSGGTARAVLEHVARSIVEDPDAVFIDSVPGRNGLRFELHVAPGDMGRIIGKRGRVAQALRALVRAAAAKDGTDASVDIVD
ncbi:MAG: KH domain-containing protein [Acidimicrobiales bacterium]